MHYCTAVPYPLGAAAAGCHRYRAPSFRNTLPSSMMPSCVSRDPFGPKFREVESTLDKCSEDMSRLTPVTDSFQATDLIRCLQVIPGLPKSMYWA